MTYEDLPADSNQPRQVVIVAMTGYMLLDFAGPADVFNSTNQVLEQAGRPPGYRVCIASPKADKEVTNAVGIKISCQYSVMEITDPIDTLLIAGSNGIPNLDDPAYAPFYDWLASVNPQTRRLGSICAGAFVLAKAGLLDGKKATTHWDRSRLLQKNYPLIRVDSNPFFVSDGRIHTSGGVSSGIDLALALVEDDYGKDIAVQVARRLVFYLNRPGFQVQFGNLLPPPEQHSLAARLKPWLAEHLHEAIEVSRMADYLNMSLRNFTRMFHRQTGVSPAKYLEKLRVEAVRTFLEDTDASLEEVAARCGLGGLVSMRRTFLRHLMVTPSDYRRAFRSTNAAIVA